MKKTYEGMFIFPKTLSNEELEEALGTVREEIEKHDGTIKSLTRLGKRQFARPMQKQDAGYYVVITFDIEGDQIAALRKRFKLNEKVFRVQIVRADPKAIQPEQEAVAEEQAEKVPA